MSNDMVVFENAEFCSIEVVLIEGKEWFVAKSITDFLGFADAGQVSRYLDDDEKTTLLIQHDGSNYKSKQVLISESGLYSLILRSRKPEAKKFKKWITSEVLPSIRKHGGYLTPEKVEEALLNPDVLIRLATELKTEREKRLEAERTKAWIGSKREATAMAKASAVARENQKLKDKLGEGATYKQAKAIPWVKSIFKVSAGMWSSLGVNLTKLSRSMDYEIAKIEDTTHGKVNAYHVSVIDRFHAQLETDPDMMKKYRI